MAKHMKNLADFLRNYSNNCHIINDSLIRSCQCLEGSPDIFHSDIIYIAHVSDLADSPPPAETVNLLLIGDKELPGSYRKGNRINWIICDPKLAQLPRLINLTAEFFREELILSQYKEEMLRVLNKSEAMQQMLEITYQYVGNPLRVIDSAHNLVVSFWAEDVLDEPQWMDYNENKIFSQKYNDICNTDFAFRRHMLNSSKPFIMNYPDIYKHRQRTLRIRESHMNIAFVSELEYNRPFTEFTSEILQIFAYFAGIRLSNDARFFCSYDSPSSEVLLYVLTSECPNSKRTGQLMRKAGLQLKKYLYLIYITDEGIFDSKEKMIYICGILDKFFAGGLTQMMEGKIIVLLDSDQCIRSPLEDDRLQSFLQILNSNHIFAGISRPFSDLTQACHAFDQAKRAFDFSRQKELPGQLFYYEDFILEDVTEAYLLKNPCINIIEPGLNELVQYDKCHGTNLMETLTYYLDHQLDLHTTSQALHIHFNTLKYRIQKIKDITMLDLSSMNTIMRIKLSFIALQIN